MRLLVLPFSLFSVGIAESVRPVDKVITLLTDLKTKVETEGTTEAGTYDQFACFCKTQTASKSTAITTGRDGIQTLSGEIEVKTASRSSKISELTERQKDQEAHAKEKAETEALLAKASSVYQVKNADLEKAISSLDNAFQAMETSKPSLLSVQAKASVKQSLALAEALNLIAESRQKEVSAFLQGGATVDPSDPGYQYHSQGILDIIKKLRVEFGQEKTDVDTEWGKTELALSGHITAVTGQMTANTAAMGTLSTEIATLKGEIATAREGLVNGESQLKDDQSYLKDLTTRCETRANDWDQRSQLRSDEITALAAALQVLTDDVQGRDTAVNNRTFFIEREVVVASPLLHAAIVAKVSKHAASPSFLQEASVVRSLLRGAHAAAFSTQEKKAKALAMLRAASQRLGSTALSAVAMHVAADPFANVKDLIQKLIERLLNESTMEATKKGFCDEQLKKAYNDREYRLADSQTLNLDIKGLELKEDELVAEIQLLTEALLNLRTTLDQATTARETESTENYATIKTAGEGVEAVKQAILILKVFYKQAGKATVLLQASPVDEDTGGAGFAGAYKGQQKASSGIIGMLEVILSDFDRTGRKTKEAEDQAHAEHVKFDRTSRADISGKETQKTLDAEDLEMTRNSITSKMTDLQTAQDLLDSALKVVEDLKPTCIDTGMTYSERVQKREEEVTALKSALCILDTDSVEADCQSR